MNDLIADYRKQIAELEAYEAELTEQLRQLHQSWIIGRKKARKLKAQIAIVEDELFDLRLALHMMEG